MGRLVARLVVRMLAWAGVTVYVNGRQWGAPVEGPVIDADYGDA